jgi:hypothetical protein
MNNIQTSKLNMYKAVIHVCESNQALANIIPASAGILQELNTGVSQIEATSLTQGLNTTGITQDKASLKHTLAELAAEVSGAVVAYAVKNKNNELRAAVDYSYTDITRYKDSDTIHYCQIILGKAQAHTAELIHYGLTANKLEELRVSIDAFSTIIGRRQAHKGTKVAATKDLDKLIEETDILLKDVLDRLVLPFKKSDVNFYNKYTHARQIIELGKRSKAEESAPVNS